VLIASYGVGVNTNHSDYLRADKAWWFVALLTIAYLVSRAWPRPAAHKEQSQGQPSTVSLTGRRSR
jgi:hypothetical protein